MLSWSAYPHCTHPVQWYMLVLNKCDCHHGYCTVRYFSYMPICPFLHKNILYSLSRLSPYYRVFSKYCRGDSTTTRVFHLKWIVPVSHNSRSCPRRDVPSSVAETRFAIRLFISGKGLHSPGSSIFFRRWRPTVNIVYTQQKKDIKTKNSMHKICLWASKKDKADRGSKTPGIHSAALLVFCNSLDFRLLVIGHET